MKTQKNQVDNVAKKIYFKKVLDKHILEIRELKKQVPEKEESIRGLRVSDINSSSDSPKIKTWTTSEIRKGLFGYGEEFISKEDVLKFLENEREEARKRIIEIPKDEKYYYLNQQYFSGVIDCIDFIKRQLKKEFDTKNFAGDWI